MWKEKVSLKLMVLNAENLFLLFAKPPSKEILKLDALQWKRLSTPIFENKPIEKCRGIASLILKAQSDIVCLTEVGGLESLENFNLLFLDSQYSPCLIEGNSDRNIDVGFLIKKNSPFYFDLETNKNFNIDFHYENEKNAIARGDAVKASAGHFSRDVAELKLFKNDRDKPFLVVLLTHLKSRLDPEKIDANGFLKRQAEMKALVSLYQSIQQNFPTTPIAITGDFNGLAGRLETDKEFQLIYDQTDWEDVLQTNNVPQDARATYYQIKNSNSAEGRQIDFAFLNRLAQSHLKIGSASVLRYLDEFGFDLPPPTSMETKTTLPSDHYPIIFELENLVLT